ncbi:hypothetical protein LNA01_14530 [Companilactobacillus nantensis]|nr:hypothetical protein LNA01_14530 [Companilactobacillus nantensis]
MSFLMLFKVRNNLKSLIEFRLIFYLAILADLNFRCLNINKYIEVKLVGGLEVFYQQ